MNCDVCKKEFVPTGSATTCAACIKLIYKTLPMGDNTMKCLKCGKDLTGHNKMCPECRDPVSDPTPVIIDERSIMDGLRALVKKYETKLTRIKDVIKELE